MDIFSKFLILYETEDLTPRLTVLSLPGSNNRYTIKVRYQYSRFLTPGKDKKSR